MDLKETGLKDVAKLMWLVLGPVVVFYGNSIEFSGSLKGTGLPDKQNEY
jgi:hypothetical protein